MGHTIGILVAMDKELELLKTIVDANLEQKKIGNEYFDFWFGYTNAAKTGETITIIIAKSGIGKANAAMMMTALINIYNVDYIISSGVCGSIYSNVEEYHQGTVVCGSSARYHDVWCGDPNETGQIQDLPVSFNLRIPDFSDFAVKECRFLTGDWFVGKEDAQKIVEKFGADYCIDMESAAIASVCYRTNVPLTCIRIISDTPLDEKAPTYEDFWVKAPNTLVGVVKYIIDFKTF